VAQLLTLLLAGEASDLKRRLRSALITYALAAVAGLLALIFLVVAIYIAAAYRWGAVQAAIGFAVVFALLALIVFGAHRISARAYQRQQRMRRAENATLAAGASAAAAIPALLGKKKLGANAALLVLAGLGGYAAYRQFEQRSRKDV